MSIQTHKAKDGVVSYYVRVGNGPMKSFSEADYETRTKAKAAAKRHEADLLCGKYVKAVASCNEYADRVLVHWEQEVMRNGRRRKESTLNTLRDGLRPFRATFGGRTLTTITRAEARDWALTQHPGVIKAACQLLNRAVEEGIAESNPFRGLAPVLRGRRDDDPPTQAEFKALLAAWSIHDKDPKHPYAFMGQAMQTFAGYTGMRPGEVFELKWDDVDFERREVAVERRLYRGNVDLPKSNRTRPIYLTADAGDAIRKLPRVSEYVFVNKSGGRLSQPTLSGYWAAVKAKAGLEFDFYHATKHFCVHDLFVVKHLSPNAIAQQMGWSLEATMEMLAIYGHGATGWRSEFAAAEGRTVPTLQAV